MTSYGVASNNCQTLSGGMEAEWPTDLTGLWKGKILTGKAGLQGEADMYTNARHVIIGTDECLPRHHFSTEMPAASSEYTDARHVII